MTKKEVVISLAIFAIVFFTTYLIIATSSFSLTNIWNATLNGPQDAHDYGYAIVLDSELNIYVVGASRWSNASNTDIYIGKFYSENGSNIWNSTIRGPMGSCTGSGLAIDSESNLYATGYCYWNYSNQLDIYLGKFYSENGSNIWNSTVNGVQNKSDYGYAVMVDNESKIYVTGATRKSSATYTDLYIGEFYSENGSNIWNTTLSGPQGYDDWGFAIKRDNQSNIYIAGGSYWSNDIGEDIYVGKFSSTGSNIWNSTIKGIDGGYSYGYGLVLDNESNVYVTGYSLWASDVDGDIYLGKFNSTSGSSVWNVTVNGTRSDSDDEGTGVTIYNNSYLYVVGDIMNSDFGDIYLGKFDLSGSNLWNFTLNGTLTYSDRGSAIVMENQSNIYITGNFRLSDLTNDLYLGKFAEIESVCTESWTCTDWSICTNSIQTRACTDTNACGTTASKPEESQSCGTGGSSSSSGGSTLSPSQTITSSSLVANQPTEFQITNPDLSITEIIVTPTQDIPSASILVAEVSISPESGFYSGAPSTGVPYQSFKISTKNLENISNVTINFIVEIAWLKQQGLTKNDILLFRKLDNETGFRALNTTFIKEDEKYYYYTAISPGFSTFAIFVVLKECTEGSLRCLDKEVQICSSYKWVSQEQCEFGCKDGKCSGTAAGREKILIYIGTTVISVGIIIGLYIMLKALPKKKHPGSINR